MTQKNKGGTNTTVPWISVKRRNQKKRNESLQICKKYETLRIYVKRNILQWNQN